MSQDKELEIRLQFLDEAQEYLGVLDAALLGLASSGVDIDKVNAALRSAHSIKGGAGMMGFQTLSEMAHRLEDSFKVLKVQRHTVDADAELEGLLLNAVDCLRQVIVYDRAATSQSGDSSASTDFHWLEQHATPIFERLHDRLGDPEAEDANSILSPEEGQEIIPMLFQTEVEGCLIRLESVIEEQSPCLREEVEILAQELGGLGEMLQLTAFSHLCVSVAQAIMAAPAEQVAEVAQLALQTWRRSQALVLTGNFEALPSALDGLSFEVEPIELVEPAWMDWEAAEITESLFGPVSEVAQDSEAGFDPVSEFDQAAEAEVPQSEFELDSEVAQASTFDPVSDFGSVSGFDPVSDPASVSDAALVSEVAQVFEAQGFEVQDFETQDLGTQDFGAAAIADDFAEVTIADSEVVPLYSAYSETEANLTEAEVISEVVPSDLSQPGSQRSQLQAPPVRSQQPIMTAGKVTEFRVPEVSLDSATVREAPENSVRVSTKQLDQLNDLFGELTIERNGLDLHLKRLRNLAVSLTQRVQILEQSNSELRDAYDRITHQPDSRFSLPDWRSPHASQVGNGTPPTANPSSAVLHRFDSLEMDRYDDLHLLSQEVMETIVQIQEINSDIELSLDDTEQTSRELNKTSRQLRTKLNQVRMRPLSDITDRFPRAIRELSLQYHKPVQLQIHGANTPIDRNVLEALSDPLLHLLRNAFDHGIEAPQIRRERGKAAEGLIEIRAFHRNNRTVITLRDDGGGIPLEKIRAKARQMGLDEMLLAAASDEELLSLIFEPGFSTNDEVTPLSGRGVGMDVVRDHLRQIHGEIKVDTQPNVGTTFTLSVPFTLSVARVLIAESNGMLMAFPIDAIEEMLLLPPEQVITTAGSEAFTWEGIMVQLIRLSRWLEFRRTYPPEGLDTQASISVPTVLLLSQGNQIVGLQVDRSWGEQEVAIRRVEGGLPMPPGFSNCTILGDGRVVPLVNLPELLRWIASCERSQADAVSYPTAPLLPTARPDTPLSSSFPPEFSSYTPERPPTILIIDDSINVRRLLALTLEKAGYQVAQAKDGQDALDKLSAGLQVNAVICDIEMPRLDGYGFLAKVKSSPPLESIPVAMLTSRSGEKHRQLAMNLGASAYFSKPYNEQVLLQTLGTLVE
ncbi:response regulator [Phormidium tenue FACHB-886]|nr:response regulator [Phormidium tenue FACHB-886]